MQWFKLGRLGHNNMTNVGRLTLPTLNGSTPISLLLGGVRTKIRAPKNTMAKHDPEGIRYHGFTYFPRYPDQVDPPYEPTKLFRVTRSISMKGAPYWDKHILTMLNLHDKNRVAIVSNTPTNNARLHRIKHMIEIQPITFPHGVPTNDTQGFLKENGEYVTYNNLESPAIDVQQGEEDVVELRRRSVDRVTLKNRLHLNYYRRW